jgi:hypothetical protein
MYGGNGKRVASPVLCDVINVVTRCMVVTVRESVDALQFIQQVCDRVQGNVWWDGKRRDTREAWYWVTRIAGLYR